MTGGVVTLAIMGTGTVVSHVIIVYIRKWWRVKHLQKHRKPRFQTTREPHQVAHHREEVDRRLLVSDLIDADLRVGHTATVPRLDEGLVLLEAVATSRSYDSSDRIHPSMPMPYDSRTRRHYKRSIHPSIAAQDANRENYAKSAKE